jgi:hypothetical protein
MARVKIVKKKTNTFNRFESDRHTRMGVRNNFYLNREAGEDPEVSIVWSEENSEEPSEPPNVVTDPTDKPDTCSPTTSLNSSFTTLMS